MDKTEAKLLLQACRSNGQDDNLPAFAEALALVERDPELKAWWEAQRAFDRAISAKLNEIPLPADLHATILAGRKIEQMTPRNHFTNWLAFAAMLAVCVGLGFHFYGGVQNHTSPQGAPLAVATSAPAPVPAVASHDYETGVFAFLDSPSISLAMNSSDHDQVAAWLKQHASPTGTIPAKMATLPTAGCQTFAVHGHTVSLICFALDGGGYAHLFVVEKQALADPPGSSPEFKQIGAWNMAAWSDDTHSYMLATQSDPDKLKQLL
jgi:hypothetical protein